ncbi:caspase family protein [Runella sp.]|uniref:caspase family protein n=1 Tax=Runella sp. TaxID=1960881 RepID=UPI0030159E10
MKILLLLLFTVISSFTFAQSKETLFDFYGKGYYTSSNLKVSKGDRINIEASGSMIVGPFAGSRTPDGADYTGIFGQNYNLIASKLHCALMVCVNESMQSIDYSQVNWQVCGSSYQFTSPSSGYLIFDLNELTNWRHDNSGSWKVKVTIETADIIPPKITLTQPNGIRNRGMKPVPSEMFQIGIAGSVTDDSGVKSLKINGEPVSLSLDNGFSKVVKLNSGENTIGVEAEDTRGNRAELQFTVERTTNPTPKESFGVYHALIIGVQDYQDPRISDLVYPVTDAKNVKQMLLDNYNFRAENVKLLLNPTFQLLENQLEAYLSQLNNMDNLLIFFAGHGRLDPISKEGYWLLADSKNDSRRTWLSNTAIRQYIKGIKTKHTLVVSDACFSGSLLRTDVTNTMVLQEIYALSSRRCITSGGYTTVPDESVFIRHFLRVLNENKEKFLTSEDFFRSFKQAVIRAAKEIRGPESVPVPQTGIIPETDDLGGDFIFVKK